MKVDESRQARTAAASRYRALAAFRYHIRKYLEFSDRAAKAIGLEPKQYQLLLAIRGLPDGLTPTVGTLAERLHTRHHSTVELVNRAEENGLVRRQRQGTFVHVLLSAKGERTLARAVEERLHELRVAGPVLVDALEKLIAARPLAKPERSPLKSRRSRSRH